MYLSRADTINYLDRIRRSGGIDSCKNYFSKLGKEHRQDAIRLSARTVYGKGLPLE